MCKEWGEWKTFTWRGDEMDTVGKAKECKIEEDMDRGNKEVNEWKEFNGGAIK